MMRYFKIWRKIMIARTTAFEDDELVSIGDVE